MHERLGYELDPHQTGSRAQPRQAASHGLLGRSSIEWNVPERKFGPSAGAERLLAMPCSCSDALISWWRHGRHTTIIVGGFPYRVARDLVGSMLRQT